MNLKERTFEAIIGVFTIVIFAVFLGFVIIKTKSVIKTHSSYSLFAKFNDIDGIDIGSTVKLSGIVIGEVENITLNESYMAVVKIKMNSKYLIPSDSSISVTTSGFIGSKFLMISPGGDEEYLKNAQYFKKTQSAIGLDGLIKSFASK